MTEWYKACARIARDPSLRLSCPSCDAATLEVTEERMTEKLERERGQPLSEQERSYISDSRSYYLVRTLSCPACGESSSVTVMQHTSDG
jgi:C4-type Zn-finger protein